MKQAPTPAVGPPSPLAGEGGLRRQPKAGRGVFLSRTSSPHLPPLSQAKGAPSPKGGEGFAPPVIQNLTSERLHLSHGPIDVVLKADGEAGAVCEAHRAAAERFPSILPELCAELSRLRAQVGEGSAPGSPVGARMARACRPFAEKFITPMAAVAGAVADELMATMMAAAPLDRAYVNDGGDIAVFCAPGHHLDVAIAGDFFFGAVPSRSGSVRITHGDGVGGVATSGARGRSFSLGIADSVTVLAADAASADAAATLIANAVDCDDAAITRRPAYELDPDSDLGPRLVTTHVGPLPPDQIHTVLAAGLACARDYRRRGLIVDAALTLQGETVTLGARLLERSAP